MINCPRCKTAMEIVRVDDVDLERCTSCAGIFFDNFELKKLDEAHEGKGSEVFSKDKTARRVAPAMDQKLPCPKCPGIIMMRRYSSVKRAVEVDECAKCGGIWVDPGEISAIRSEFATEEDRIKAADKIFGEMFGVEMEAQRQSSQAQKQTFARASSALRFLGGRRRF